MLKKLLYLTAVALICGCSTSKNDDVSSESATALQSNEIQSANAADLPYTFTLSGENKGDKTIVTLQVEYNVILSEAPVMTITPHGDTTLENMRLVSKLEVPEKPGIVTKTLVLNGTDPGIDVSIELKSGFMAIELHDSWPPKKKARDLESGQPMEDLPAPIEVEGTPIYQGIDVHP